MGEEDIGYLGEIRGRMGTQQDLNHVNQMQMEINEEVAAHGRKGWVTNWLGSETFPNRHSQMHTGT